MLITITASMITPLFTLFAVSNLQLNKKRYFRVRFEIGSIFMTIIFLVSLTTVAPHIIYDFNVGQC